MKKIYTLLNFWEQTTNTEEHKQTKFMTQEIYCSFAVKEINKILNNINV